MTKRRIIIIFSILPVLVLAFGVLIAAIAANMKTQIPDIAKFNSCHDIADWVNSKRQESIKKGRMQFGEDSSSGNGVAPSPSIGKSNDYSTTNVQVAGVDEADVVKNDSRQVFAIQGEEITVLVKEGEIWKIVDSIKPKFNATGLFLTEQKLIVLGYSDAYTAYNRNIMEDRATPLIAPYKQQTIIATYNRDSLAQDHIVAYDGGWQTARLIENKVYLVSTQPGLWYSDVTVDMVESSLVTFKTGDAATDKNREGEVLTNCDEIYHFGSNPNNWVNITSFDVDSKQLQSRGLLGSSDTIYVSTKNLYIAAAVYPEVEPVPCSFLEQISSICASKQALPANAFTATTDIYKFDLTNLEAKAKGNISGRLLNQFSLDEHSGFLRVAATVDASSGRSSSNAVFVLDDKLNAVGNLTDLAFTERIYAARFIGDRLYLVTFRNIDPLYVIDLSNPKQPSVLGELKIPGFSNYLHPYDENTIIGFGKDADPSSGRVREMKLALFDVRNVSAPQQIAEYKFAAGVDSEILFNHKALYFEREQNLMGFSSYDTYGKGAAYTYNVFKINAKTIELSKQLDTGSRVINYAYNAVYGRAVRIGEQLIVIGSQKVQVLNKSTLELLQTINW
jgi:inhibitor of cysteine peptidase